MNRDEQLRKALASPQYKARREQMEAELAALSEDSLRDEVRRVEEAIATTAGMARGLLMLGRIVDANTLGDALLVMQRGLAQARAALADPALRAQLQAELLADLAAVAERLGDTTVVTDGD